MLVKDWIDQFMINHQARYRVADWPERGCEDYAQFASVWLKTFIAAKVSPEEADAASYYLGECPPNFAREHLPGLMCQIRAGRVKTSSQMTRIEAEKSSRDCPFCEGTGMPFVFRPEFNGSHTIEALGDKGERVNVAASVNAYCECNIGKWIQMRHEQDAECKEVLARMPRLSQVLHGNSIWLEFDPSYSEASVDQIDHAGLRRMLAQRIAARTTQ